MKLQFSEGTGPALPRVRSVSMLSWVGGRGGLGGFPDDLGYSHTSAGTNHGEYRIYYRMADMITPGPGKTFVFIDERMDSINDGMFVVDMLTYPDTTLDICDLPAQYHEGAANLSFADGHAETKKWTTPLLLTPAQPNTITPYPTSLIGSNADAFWLMDHATRIIP